MDKLLFAEIAPDERASGDIEQADKNADSGHGGEITITSPNENVILRCAKVVSSQEFKTGKNSPKLALYGTVGAFAQRETSTFLGWYAAGRAFRGSLRIFGTRCKTAQPSMS
ncbi:MAG: hypothetical protein PHI27_01850 [Eubacteriales bacterium]|nr:hypothetical protein [Eubacteriales bacterium]MDD3880975.1 hypothetical protein [Eubacteriales bacterium]MDD4511956.1 hypothetical protein [Eubacteriales bacterium]